MNFKLLKNKNFSLLVFGELVSMFGSGLQSFALSLYVLKLTGSASKFASVLAISLIPQLVLAPFAGVLIDWFDRKKIIISINVLNSIVVLFLSLIFLKTGGISLAYIYVSVLILSFNNVMFSPAVRTVIPTVVEKENLMNANSLNSFVQGLAEIASPLCAGTILAFYSLLPILILNCSSFIIAAICELFIALPKHKKIDKPMNISSFFSDFKEGLLFAKKENLILALSISAFIINFALPPISNLGFTFISKEVLKVSDANYGLMSTIAGLGMILGPIIAGFISKKIELTKLFNFGMILISILISLIALVITPLYLNLFASTIIPMISLTLIMLFIIAIMMMINISLSTMFQSTVPNELLGRVGSVFSVICSAAHPLGQIIFGNLFDVIPGYYVILISAGILLLSVVIFKLLISNNNATVPVE